MYIHKVRRALEPRICDFTNNPLAPGILLLESRTSVVELIREPQSHEQDLDTKGVHPWAETVLDGLADHYSRGTRQIDDILV